MGLSERASAAVLLLFLAAVSVGRRQTVEEVTKKQLEAAVAEEDYLAVYWCESNRCTFSSPVYTQYVLHIRHFMSSVAQCSSSMESKIYPEQLQLATEIPLFED